MNRDESAGKDAAASDSQVGADEAKGSDVQRDRGTAVVGVPHLQAGADFVLAEDRTGKSGELKDRAISEFPKWRKYLILLSFLDNSSARPVQIGGVDVNICHSRSTAVRGRRRSSSQSPPRGPFCRTRTGPVEADGAVDAQNAPTRLGKRCAFSTSFHRAFPHQVTHEKLRKAPKYRWETRIDPKIARMRAPWQLT